MTAIQSTFSATQEHLAAPAPEQNNEQTSQVAESTQIQAASTATTETTSEQPAAQTQEQDFSQSSVTLDFEGAAPTDAAAANQSIQYNWKDELKKVDRKELLKELGVSDFALEIDTHINNGGQPLDYLNAKAIDYNQVSDDNLLKESLRKEYPNLSPSQIDLMFNRKYGVTEEMEEGDKDFVNTQKQADAYKVRQAKITDQQKFKIPDTPIPQTSEAYEQWKQLHDKQPQLLKELTDYYSNHGATKSLNESKRVAISLGEGVQPFNFNVDKPEMVTRALTDGGEILQKLTSTQSGEPDVAKQQLILLFSLNPQKFAQDIFNYGKQMGVRSKVEEGQNGQRPQAKMIPMENNQPATYKASTYNSK